MKCQHGARSNGHSSMRGLARHGPRGIISTTKGNCLSGSKRRAAGRNEVASDSRSFLIFDEEEFPCGDDEELDYFDWSALGLQNLFDSHVDSTGV